MPQVSMRTSTSPRPSGAPVPEAPSAFSGTGTVSTRTSFTPRYTAARIVSGIVGSVTIGFALILAALIGSQLILSAAILAALMLRSEEHTSELQSLRHIV